MHWIFYSFVYFFICAVAFAQEYPFVNYTPKDGLANSLVKSAFQDSKGRMFFLTHTGLSVYDGTRFKNYTQSSGLANDIVNDIFEAGQASVLIATNTGVLNTLVHGKTGIYQTSDGFCPVINHFFKSRDNNL